MVDAHRGIVIAVFFLSFALFAFVSAYLNGAWGMLSGVFGLVLLAVGFKILWANIF
jgi:hypothetical protein